MKLIFVVLMLATLLCNFFKAAADQPQANVATAVVVMGRILAGTVPVE